MDVSFGHAGYNKTAFPVRKRIITVGPKGGLGCSLYTEASHRVHKCLAGFREGLTHCEAN